MWPKELKIAMGFLGLATFQVAWHWFLSTHNVVAETLLRLYLHYNPRTGKGVAGWFDLDIPAIVLGLFIGRVAWQCSIRKLSCFVALGGMGLMMLLPIYVLFLHKQQVWWWPRTNNAFVAWLIRETVFTLFLLAVCVYGGRGWGAYSHGVGTGVWSKDQAQQQQGETGPASQKSSGHPPRGE